MLLAILALALQVLAAHASMPGNCWGPLDAGGAFFTDAWVGYVRLTDSNLSASLADTMITRTSAALPARTWSVRSASPTGGRGSPGRRTTAAFRSTCHLRRTSAGTSALKEESTRLKKVHVASLALHPDLLKASPGELALLLAIQTHWFWSLARQNVQEPSVGVEF